MQDNHELIGRYRCILKSYIGQLCSLILLQTFNGYRRLYFPKICGHFLLTRDFCPPQVGHNYFNYLSSSETGLFIIKRLWESRYMASRRVPQWSDRRPRSEVPDGRYRMDETDNYSNEHYYHWSWKSAACRCHFSGMLAIMFHMYLLPQGSPLKDALAFSYGLSFKRKVRLWSSESSGCSDG